MGTRSNHSTRNSEERSRSLFVEVLNEEAQAVFKGCPGREFILYLNKYRARPFLTVPIAVPQRICCWDLILYNDAQIYDFLKLYLFRILQHCGHTI